MEPKVKTQKIPRASSKTPKKSTFVCTLFTELRSQGTTDSFQYPQKIPTQIKLPKKILAKFSYPKIPGIENFKPKKILRSSPSLEIPSTPPGGGTGVGKLKIIMHQSMLSPRIGGLGIPRGICYSTWPTALQNYWNKRTFLNKKRVQSPQDQFGTPTWPLFYCFWTPTWQTLCRVKTLYNFPRGIH